MKRIAAVLAALLLAGITLAGDLKLPAEVQGQPGGFVRVPAETAGKIVRWFAVDAGLNVFPVELLKDSKTAVVSATAAGRYRLLAYTAIEGVPSEPAVCVVVIGDAPPPGPDPVPPGPTDPLVQSLQPLYAADISPKKGEYKASLAALYRQAVTTAKDARLTSPVQLYRALQEARRSLMPDDALTTVRQKLAEVLDAELPTKVDATLDTATREKAGILFARIAAALEVLK